MIKKTIEKMCEFCGHALNIHKYNHINQCALCECSLSQAPRNKWWEKLISWLT